METLEQELEQLQERVNQPDFYSQDQAIVSSELQQLAEKEQQLEAYFERWEELESMK